MEPEDHVQKGVSILRFPWEFSMVQFHWRVEIQKTNIYRATIHIIYVYINVYRLIYRCVYIIYYILYIIYLIKNPKVLQEIIPLVGLLRCLCFGGGDLIHNTSPQQKSKPKMFQQKHHNNRPMNLEPNDKKTTMTTTKKPTHRWFQGLFALLAELVWINISVASVGAVVGYEGGEVIRNSREFSARFDLWNHPAWNFTVLEPNPKKSKNPEASYGNTRPPPFMTSRFQGLKTGGFDWHPGRHLKDS